MKVRCKNVDNLKLSEELGFFYQPGQHFVTPGTEYLALAVSIFQNVPFVLICDDNRLAQLEPLALFDTTDHTLDDRWICNLHAGNEVSLLLGPEFIASSIESYDRLVDQEVAMIDQVWDFYRGQFEDTGEEYRNRHQN